MNLHPIVVHFPIALLIVYSLLEIVSLFSTTLRDKLYTTKTICLWIGAVGSFFALMSGEAAQDLIGRSNLIHTHEERAEKSHSLYVILSIYYLVKTIIEQQIGAKYRTSITKQYISQIKGFLLSRWTAIIVTILSIVGIGLLTIVGALGGAISRGTGTGDPMSDWAVKTLVGTVVTQAPRTKTTAETINTGSTTTDVTITPPAESANPTNTTTSYTMAQVAEHKDEASCRSAINGVIYDLSAFITKHPGGDRNILKICGIDGSSAFNGKHGGQMKPEQTLAGFEIGVLAK